MVPSRTGAFKTLRLPDNCLVLECGYVEQSVDADTEQIHADEGDQPAVTARPDGARDPLRPDARVDLVLYGDLDLDLVAEHSIVDALASDAIKRCKRIGRDVRSHPLDDVAIVVVMGRFDQEESKNPPLRLDRVVGGNLIPIHSATPFRLSA